MKRCGQPPSQNSRSPSKHGKRTCTSSQERSSAPLSDIPEPDDLDYMLSSQTSEPTTPPFTPSKITTPIKKISGSNALYDGGADYSRPCSASQVPVKRALYQSDEELDPDLLQLTQDMDHDPDFEMLEEWDAGPQKVDYINRLPLDLLENILARLPMVDLCRQVSRVCLRLRDIISQDKYLQWKKTYHRVLYGDSQHKQRVLDLMRAHGMDMQHKQTMFPALIGYMKSYLPRKNNEYRSNVLDCLRKHPKYSWGEAVIRERLEGRGSEIGPQLPVEEPNPWCVMTALILLSEDVDDILHILLCLLCPRSMCTAAEVIEALYCVNSFLLVFKHTYHQECWTGIHYRLYYGLYLYENSAVVREDEVEPRDAAAAARFNGLCFPAAPSNATVFTQEQMRICNHHVGPGELLKIVAFAGTGKTTTLIRYAQLRPTIRFLLVVFNKSIMEHSAKRFPPNVLCSTIHSLAHKDFGCRYKKKASKFYVSQMVKVIPHRRGESLYVQAKLVVDTLQQFMCSDDLFINHSHVPMTTKNKQGAEEYLGEERRSHLVRDARRVWDLGKDPGDKRITFTHDGYLKLYQLSLPIIHHQDVLLIDEAQDLTPAVINILLRQPQPKVLVGDPHQQIYSFRGAVNAMDIVRPTSTYYLTQSFRFGSNIACVANTCLEILKREKKKILVGNTSKGAVDGRRIGQLAILTRTNFTLFVELVNKCCHTAQDIKIAITGGADNFGFDMILKLHSLMTGGQLHRSDDFLSRQYSLGSLKSYASETLEHDLLGKIHIVETYCTQIPEFVSKIQQCCVESMEAADVVFSTAHKAKGLEFSTVRLTDDFASGFVPAGSNAPVQGGKDEYNLLYVAVTRAKKSLQLTPTLMRLLQFSGERFRFPRLSCTLPKPLTCMLTGQEFGPCALTLQRKRIVLGISQMVAEGLYSPQVVTEDLRVWSGLLGVTVDERDNLHGRTARVSEEPCWEPHRQMNFANIVGLFLNLPGFNDEGEDEQHVPLLL